MSIPDFNRAEYTGPRRPAPYADVLPPSPYTAVAPPPAAIAQSSSYDDPIAPPSSDFAKSLAFGAGAAVLGAVGYGLIGLSGFMVSIVAIGVGWLIATAMMTGSRGVGGRRYQVAAVILTYFACNAGSLLDYLWTSRADLGHHSAAYLAIFSMVTILIEPFLELSRPFNGAIGLLILFVGLRAAWRIAQGGQQVAKFERPGPEPPTTLGLR